MNLDELSTHGSSEPLSERFWRRYGLAAFHLLEHIRQGCSCARLLRDAHAPQVVMLAQRHTLQAQDVVGGCGVKMQIG